jgi:hypothetical protein
MTSCVVLYLNKVLFQQKRGRGFPKPRFCLPYEIPFCVR